MHILIPPRGSMEGEHILTPPGAPRKRAHQWFRGRKARMDTPRGAKEWGICGHHQGYQGKREHMDPRRGVKERGHIRIPPRAPRKGAQQSPGAVLLPKFKISKKNVGKRAPLHGAFYGTLYYQPPLASRI